MLWSAVLITPLGSSNTNTEVFDASVLDLCHLTICQQSLTKMQG